MPGRATDDRRQLLLGVVVEPVDGAEAIAQRARRRARARRGADYGERLERQAQAARGRPATDHHVDREVLHRRIEDLLDRVVEAVDLVDEQDVALVEVGQDRGQVAGPLDRRPLVAWRFTPSSRAMMLASVVLPRPGGPYSRTWSAASSRWRAAASRIAGSA